MAVRAGKHEHGPVVGLQVDGASFSFGFEWRTLGISLEVFLIFPRLPLRDAITLESIQK
jgi:hypothetical protein